MDSNPAWDVGIFKGKIYRKQDYKTEPLRKLKPLIVLHPKVRFKVLNFKGKTLKVHCDRQKASWGSSCIISQHIFNDKEDYRHSEIIGFGLFGQALHWNACKHHKMYILNDPPTDISQWNKQRWCLSHAWLKENTQWGLSVSVPTGFFFWGGIFTAGVFLWNILFSPLKQI